MRLKDRDLAQRLYERLLDFEQLTGLLPGVHTTGRRTAFMEQLIESIRRVCYVRVVRSRDVSEWRADPSTLLFDPLKAAILHSKSDRMDEAFWLVFLFVHFGKHVHGGWRYAREIYGRLGEGRLWDWENTSTSPDQFREWLHNHQQELKRPACPGGFGNHRKYESLDARSKSGTGATVQSYVEWIGPSRKHVELFSRAVDEAREDSRIAFDILFRSMKSVVRFGRTARFDYLAMIGKLGLANIEPGSAYLKGSTGPASGARLLFANDSHARLQAAELEMRVVELESHLRTGFQVLEDALCNWQKSPDTFRPFRS